MRVADNMNFNQVNRNVSKNRAEASDLQNQAATMKRITKPSDDAVATVKLLATRTELHGIEQYLRNINNAKTFLDYTEQSLGEITDYLVRAKELAIQQSSSGSATAATRSAIAGEVHQIFDQIVQIGNRKLGERFIFGGFKTQSAPFDTRGEYKGDTGQMMIEINKGSFVGMNVAGNQVFLGDKLDYRATTEDKTIVPQTADQLNQAVQKAEQQEQSRLENQPAETPPGIPRSEQSTVHLRGPASVSPASSPDAGSKAEEKTSEKTGENIFNMLLDLEIGLRTNDPTTIQQSLDRIDTAIDQVVTVRSQVGTRQAAVTAQQDSLQKYSVDSKAYASQLEDADVFQVYNDLNKNENTLKATLNSSGKLVQLSLLDFLR